MATLNQRIRTLALLGGKGRLEATDRVLKRHRGRIEWLG